MKVWCGVFDELNWFGTFYKLICTGLFTPQQLKYVKHKNFKRKKLIKRKKEKKWKEYLKNYKKIKTQIEKKTIVRKGMKTKQ